MIHLISLHSRVSSLQHQQLSQSINQAQLSSAEQAVIGVVGFHTYLHQLM